ncbi:hypothetical protein BC940DRAFT_118882 [Gongronella butleri]|nr:hypothetical protein BC940DRAFT_118882 [Gongronella butleri]
MGRLQDQHYHKTHTTLQQQTKDEQKNRLLNEFCPPLDSALVEAIWLDTLSYASAREVLHELAQEANLALSVQEETLAAEYEQLSIPGGGAGDCAAVNDDGATTDEPTTATSSSMTSATTSHTTPSSIYDQQDQQDDVAFLAVCFPTIPKEKLLAVLQAYNDDVEQATDVLLNTVFLDDNASLQPDNDDILLYGTRPTGKQRKKKTKRRAATDPASGSAGNNGKARVLLSTAAAAPGSAAYGANAYDDGSDTSFSSSPSSPYAPQIAFNYWHQYDDTVTAIRQVFPGVSTPVAILNDVRKCHGNLIASVVLLMQKHTNAQPMASWPLAENIDTLVDDMAKQLGANSDRTRDDLRRVAIGVLIQSSHNASIDQMGRLGVDFCLNYERQQRDLQERLDVLRRAPQQAATNGGDQPILPDYLMLSNRDTYTNDDPHLCRIMAMELMARRNELYQKAAEAHRLHRHKNSGESGIAFFYSNEAREIETQANNWNLRAAKALVREKRLARNDDHLIDLHGLMVSEAQKLVEEALTQWWSRSHIQQSRRPLLPMQIVTGAGNHSHRGAARLQPAIEALLKRGGWKYEMTNPGSFVVKGVVSRTNS